MSRAAPHPVAPSTTISSLWESAAGVLDINWAGDHSRPSQGLYPHQWSWDTGFVSIGMARHRPERAWRDLRSLFEAQWPDGRVPHIVFAPGEAERHYFPGPVFWTTAPVPGRPGWSTSGVVQPPVHALAVREVARTTGTGGTCAASVVRAELAWLYPRLVAQQRYLAEHRDVGGGGLVAIVHPWESGLDNSPAWDPTLAAVPADPELLRRYSRQDLRTVAAEHRPTDRDYTRYISIAESYRAGGYSDDGLLERHPFLVECPSFNAIYAAAELALADIAVHLDLDPTEHRERAARITRALVERLLDPATGTFHARDLRTDKLSPARYIGGLIPLILPDLPAQYVTSVLAEARSARFGLADDMTLPLPSYDRTAPDFDPLRYWRGPIWINMNWLLWQGLLTHGHTTAAAALRTAMLDTIGRSGCYEYFHPHTGAGIGSPTFGWTAALALDLLSTPSGR